jgi:hypothetical protein
VDDLLVVMVMDGKAAHVQASPFVYTQRKDGGLYSLEALLMELDAVKPSTVLILPDGTDISEGMEITDKVRLLALPLDNFLRATKEQAAADALGLVIRASVVDGLISDKELLRVAPALAERVWRAGLDVVAGDVYAHLGCLWRCVTPHTTQDDWRPDKVPALWRRVEVITPDAPRIWQANTDYMTGDKVHYPDAKSPLYRCMQGHMSQTGWEPPNVPALWQRADKE